jgi:hypothetical protein
MAKANNWTTSDAIQGCGLWVLVHLAMRAGVMRLVDETLPTAGNSPRHAYWQGLIVQLAIGPLMALAYAAWYEKHRRSGVRDWLATSMLGKEAFYSRLFFFNLVAHFVKDFLNEMEPMIVAHHVFCIAILYLQAQVIVDGAQACLLGCAFFEFGSAFYNLTRLWPGVQSCMTAYLIVMTVSNICATWTLWVWVQLPGHPRSVDFFAVAVTLTLVYMRQKTAMVEFASPTDGSLLSPT